ncbi:hypothetical protein DI383_00775 [Flavobacteriaceae bacterium LYZ1037]|nr:hypothetical protein DI383_00775 [Flavobacteriaceae bacterium LYZ1037]
MNCKNCETLLKETDLFCSVCGGKIIKNRLTIANLFSHFSEQFLNYDNRFIQTLIKLFTDPVDVIDGYIKGVRKKYVNVISYFAIALTLSGFQMFFINKFFPELMNMDAPDPKGMEGFQQKNMDFLSEYQGLIYMALVPLYAIISRITFFNYKTYNYTEHVVINMYISAQAAIVSTIIILISALTNLNILVITFILLPLQALYSAYSFKKLYQLNFKSILLKFILFLLILILLIVVCIILTLIVVLIIKKYY